MPYSHSSAEPMVVPFLHSNTIDKKIKILKPTRLKKQNSSKAKASACRQIERPDTSV